MPHMLALGQGSQPVAESPPPREVVLKVEPADVRGVIQRAISLLNSPTSHARQNSTAFLSSFILSHGRLDLHIADWYHLGIIEKGIRLPKKQPEPPETHEAVLTIFLAIGKHQRLPVEKLLEAGVQEDLARLTTTSGAAAGHTIACYLGRSLLMAN